MSYAKKDDLIRRVACFNEYESDINTIQTRTTVELVVFATSLKFFFVEGGEQFIVGIQTAKKIGLRATVRITIAGVSFATVRITIAGVSFAVILFFLLFYSHALISARWLELTLGISLYLFAARMFKEVIQKEDEEREFQEKAYKYGYTGRIKHQEFRMRVSNYTIDTKSFLLFFTSIKRA
ncbi:MAG: hypothetical protein M3Y53_03810 [Thermoproteota archaeon]|nr:hypothetical protein [Thermoproteota archaeon]